MNIKGTGAYIDKNATFGQDVAMPRIARVAPGGMLFHVLNRGVGRMRLFRTDRDYQAFAQVVEETLRIAPIRVCGYCWMPNHWHFVLWPERDGDLSGFMQRMTNMHTQRWQRAKRRVGYGHLYQGRFKSFPIASDEHFYSVVRYVERNALRAGLVEARSSGRGAASAAPRALGRDFATGRCHARPTGLSRSTRRRRRPSLSGSAARPVAATPLGAPCGASRRRSNWACSQRSAHAADPASNRAR